MFFYFLVFIPISIVHEFSVKGLNKSFNSLNIVNYSVGIK